jgi:hypothetical protein
MSRLVFTVPNRSQYNRVFGPEKLHHFTGTEVDPWLLLLLQFQ